MTSRKIRVWLPADAKQLLQRSCDSPYDEIPADRLPADVVAVYEAQLQKPCQLIPALVNGDVDWSASLFRARGRRGPSSARIGHWILAYDTAATAASGRSRSNARTPRTSALTTPAQSLQPTRTGGDSEPVPAEDGDASGTERDEEDEDGDEAAASAPRAKTRSRLTRSARMPDEDLMESYETLIKKGWCTAAERRQWGLSQRVADGVLVLKKRLTAKMTDILTKESPVRVFFCVIMRDRGSLSRTPEPREP